MAGRGAVLETGFSADVPAVVEEGDFELGRLAIGVRARGGRVPEEGDMVLSGECKVILHSKVFLDCTLATETPKDGAWAGAGKGGTAGDFVDGVVVAGRDEVVACGGAGGYFVDAWGLCQRKRFGCGWK